MNRMEDDIVQYLFRTQLPSAEEAPRMRAPKPQVKLSGPSLESAIAVAEARKTAKIGRNDPCPCGSGKKYKKCCGANA